MYLNDQLILQGHLKLFQECHHLCLRLQKYLHSHPCSQELMTLGKLTAISERPLPYLYLLHMLFRTKPDKK